MKAKPYRWDRWFTTRATISGLAVLATWTSYPYAPWLWWALAFVVVLEFLVVYR